MARPDRRKAILRAAERLLQGRRFDDVTLDAVAAAARVGKGTIYTHFRDKEDLLFQVVVEGFEDLRDRLQSAALSDLPTGEKLCAVARCVADSFREHHVLVRAILTSSVVRNRPGAREALRAHHQRTGAVIRKVIEEGIGRGEIRADVDAAVAECVLMGALHARNHHAAAGIVREIPVEAVIDFILAGAAPHRLRKGARAR